MTPWWMVVQIIYQVGDLVADILRLKEHDKAHKDNGVRRTNKADNKQTDRRQG